MSLNSSEDRSYRVPFSGVGYRYGPEEVSVVTRAMAAETTLTQGSQQTEFEQSFSDFLGGSVHCFATSSAASAIELAAILCGVGPNDEVIVPAHTYNASAYPFARRGATLKWADIDPNTFVMDPTSVQSLITDKTKAIVVVHLYGLPVDLHPIVDLARHNNILVLEDCAQSIGARYRGELTGTFGDLSVFSFQSHKNVSTLGEGGMLVVANADLARHVPGLRHNGHRPFQRDDDRYWYPAMSDVGFDIENEWPHNFCLGEIQAALGTFLLTKIESINALRRERFLRATNSLAEFSEIKFQTIPNDCVSSHHLLPFRYDSVATGHSNHDFMRELAYGRGIQCATQYYPLYRYALFRDSGNGEADVPVTDDFFDNMVSLPFHSWMSEEDFSYMIDEVASVAETLRAR